MEEITVGSGLTLSGGTLSATGGGSGDVVGPASSTDNAIVRFDSTTGKLIQNSAVSIDDTGLYLTTHAGNQFSFQSGGVLLTQQMEVLIGLQPLQAKHGVCLIHHQ